VCDFHDALPLLAENEFVLDTPLVREFAGAVRALIDAAASPDETCGLVEPRFEGLLADRSWLPERYQKPAARAVTLAATFARS
jgi:hypothetical protein